MMRSRPALMAVLPLLLFLVASMAAGQPAPAFTLVGRIGAPAPQGVVYDPVQDRLALVTPAGSLILADAATLEPHAVLYERGPYYGYTFSHNGEWLAVAREQTVEVWQTATGQRDLVLTPTVAYGFLARLEFSDDDTLLLFTAFVPAPDDIRRSIDDRTLAPWLWDLEAERGNRTSILPEQFRAQPFFDLRTALLLAPNNLLIAALPRSIGLTSFASGGYRETDTIPTSRFEFDPIDVWYSLRGESAYFRAQTGEYFQIDTETGTARLLPLGSDARPGALQPEGELVFSPLAGAIGMPGSRQSNSLLRLLLGDEYTATAAPLTILLLDILTPVTVTPDQSALLLYVFNEATGRGTLELVRPGDATQIALNPDGTRLAVRRASGERPIQIYNLSTGVLESAFAPALLPVAGNDLFAFTASGDELIVGWGRYDSRTGMPRLTPWAYQPGYEHVAFTADSTALITVSGTDWLRWDISGGFPTRRETIRLEGMLAVVSPDRTRYLTRLPFPDEVSDPAVSAGLGANALGGEAILPGSGVEVLDIATGTRQRVIFAPLAGYTIEQVIASPDWGAFLVVYTPTASVTPPGSAVALYSLAGGQPQFYASDDLPPAANRRYGWLDAATALVTGDPGGAGEVPERIYGLEYHPSGLPACLPMAFPDTWSQWQPVWERLTATLSPGRLARLAHALCQAQPTTPQQVDALLFPISTPGRPPMQPTSARIAGLPACLAAAFPADALAYAQEWRRITAGLTDDEIRTLENILCEGLTTGAISPALIVDDPLPRTAVVVMTIDRTTGERTLIASAPEPAARPPLPDALLTALWRTIGYVGQQVILSPDASLIAVRTPLNHIEVYRLVRPYQEYVDDVLAVQQATASAQPRAVALAATATPPPTPLGGPRPTLTPTITPTIPPPAQATAVIAAGTTRDLCAEEQVYTPSAPAAGYAARGRLLGWHADGLLWEHEAATGRVRYNEAQINLGTGVLSPDGAWLLQTDQRGVVVSRPDGSAAVVLFDATAVQALSVASGWLSSTLLRLTYRDYLPDVSSDAVGLQRDYHVETGALSAPVTPAPPITYNELAISGAWPQPEAGPYTLVALPFNTGIGTGQRYFLLNTATGVFDYFARTGANMSLNFAWNPRGLALYYQLPQDGLWYVFDPATGMHARLGDALPSGVWSPTGRYRARWELPSAADVAERQSTGTAIPKLVIWDSQTGETRRYCIPRSGSSPLDAPLIWSPDGNYLAFTALLPDEAGLEAAQPRTLILDRQTGSVTALTLLITQLMVWVE